MKRNISLYDTYLIGNRVKDTKTYQKYFQPSHSKKTYLGSIFHDLRYITPLLLKVKTYLLVFQQMAFNENGKNIFVTNGLQSPFSSRK